MQLGSTKPPSVDRVAPIVPRVPTRRVREKPVATHAPWESTPTRWGLSFVCRVQWGSMLRRRERVLVRVVLREPTRLTPARQVARVVSQALSLP